MASGTWGWSLWSLGIHGLSQLPADTTSADGSDPLPHQPGAGREALHWLDRGSPRALPLQAAASSSKPHLTRVKVSPTPGLQEAALPQQRSFVCLSHRLLSLKLSDLAGASPGSRGGPRREAGGRPGLIRRGWEGSGGPCAHAGSIQPLLSGPPTLFPHSSAPAVTHPHPRALCWPL